MNLRLSRRGRLADAEPGSRLEQIASKSFCGRMRAPEHAPRDPFHVLESRHGLAQIVERGAAVFVERLRITPPNPEREIIEQTRRCVGRNFISAQAPRP